MPKVMGQQYADKVTDFTLIMLKRSKKSDSCEFYLLYSWESCYTLNNMIKSTSWDVTEFKRGMIVRARCMGHSEVVHTFQIPWSTVSRVVPHQRITSHKGQHFEQLFMSTSLTRWSSAKRNRVWKSIRRDQICLLKLILFRDIKFLISLFCSIIIVGLIDFLLFSKYLKD